MKRKKFKKNYNNFNFTIIHFYRWNFLLIGQVVFWEHQERRQQFKLGVGLPAETTLSLVEAQRTQGLLVPAGYETTGSVSQITITYEVELVPNDDGAVGAEATLSVTHGVLGSPLINVSIVIPNSTVIVGGATVFVYVSITLTEPANQRRI